MNELITLRRMSPQEAANAVFGPELDLAIAQISPREARLAGITADEAAQQAMPKNTIRSTAGFTQTVYNNIVQAASQGNFATFNPTNCSGITPSGAKIVNTAGGLALTGLGTGFAVAGVASSIAAPITAGASLLVGLFGSIFSHHAAKVKQEQQTICAAVPAASDSLKAIDQAVKAGTITPDQGIQALQNLLSSFQQAVAPIIKMDSSHCNAACVWVKQLTAIVIKKSSDYQDMETVQAAASSAQAAASQPITSAAGTPTGSAAAVASTGQLSSDLSSVPTWAWIAAAAGILLVLAK
jgi:hypothetical protein